MLEFKPKKLSSLDYILYDNLMFSCRDWNNEFLRFDLNAYPGSFENLETLFAKSFLID